MFNFENLDYSPYLQVFPLVLDPLNLDRTLPRYHKVSLYLRVHPDIQYLLPSWMTKKPNYLKVSPWRCRPPVQKSSWQQQPLRSLITTEVLQQLRHSRLVVVTVRLVKVHISKKSFLPFLNSKQSQQSPFSDFSFWSNCVVTLKALYCPGATLKCSNLTISSKLLHSSSNLQ